MVDDTVVSSLGDDMRSRSQFRVSLLEVFFWLNRILLPTTIAIVPVWCISTLILEAGPLASELQVVLIHRTISFLPFLDHHLGLNL